MAIISPVLGFLTTNHLALLITPVQTYLAHLQFTEAQQETSKASLLAECIAIAGPWCEAVQDLQNPCNMLQPRRPYMEVNYTD